MRFSYYFLIDINHGEILRKVYVGYYVSEGASRQFLRSYVSVQDTLVPLSV